MECAIRKGEGMLRALLPEQPGDLSFTIRYLRGFAVRGDQPGSSRAMRSARWTAARIAALSALGSPL